MKQNRSSISPVPNKLIASLRTIKSDSEEEIEMIDAFLKDNKDLKEYKTPAHKSLLRAIIENRLACEEWRKMANLSHILRIYQLIRLLCRESTLISCFNAKERTIMFEKDFGLYSIEHFKDPLTDIIADVLIEIATILRSVLKVWDINEQIIDEPNIYIANLEQLSGSNNGKLVYSVLELLPFSSYMYNFYQVFRETLFSLL